MNDAPKLRPISASVVVALIGFVGCGSASETPSDPAADFAHAVWLLRNDGDVSSVPAVIDRLRQIDKFDKHGQLLEAGLLLHNGKISQALLQLNAMDPQGELVGPARLWTAESLYRSGLLIDAIKCVQPLTQDGEYATDAHRWLAAIHFDLGANDTCLQHLQEVIKRRPGDFRPHLLAARMYRDFSQHEVAQIHYEAAKKIVPISERDQVLIELGECRMMLRDYQHALAAFREASQTPSVLAMQGQCQKQLGNLAEARRSLDAALKQDPVNPEVLSLQADMFVNDGEYEKALRILRILVQRSPFEHNLRYRLALTCKQAGRSEEAAHEFEMVEDLRKKYDRLSELNNAAIASPNDAAVRRELAEMCRQLGRLKLATVWTNAAVAIENGQ